MCVIKDLVQSPRVAADTFLLHIRLQSKSAIRANRAKKSYHLSNNVEVYKQFLWDVFGSAIVPRDDFLTAQNRGSERLFVTFLLEQTLYFRV